MGLSTPGLAQAGNSLHKRTPVVWPEAPCIQSATLGSSFVFGYDIPFEDTMLSIDELEDSRRHQFIAFCRQWPGGRPPPAYVSVADLERAIDAGLEDPVLADDPETTLETSVEWAGCWARITPDEDRRPITEAAAAEPVEWSLEGVAPGTWAIAGYTWEPPINLWRRAPWVVRVATAEPSAASQPAAAIDDLPDGINPDEVLSISVCVEAELGSSASLEWSLTDEFEPAWTAVETLAVDSSETGELEFGFSSPEAAIGQAVFVRARVESPSAPSYVAHSPDPVLLYKPGGVGDGDGDGDEGGDDEGSGESGTESAGATESGAESTIGPSGGCRMSAPSPSRGLGTSAALLSLLFFLRRRCGSRPAARI